MTGEVSGAGGSVTNKRKGQHMSNYSQSFATGYPVAHQPPRTALARVGAPSGVMSVCFGMILLIPVLEVAPGTLALARGTTLTGRAVTGLILGATFLPPWAGFIALCVYSYTRARP
ncbi:hypothetical protein AX769_22450 (plasmid) [Frondihabitans sp. PAMC 28766]|nr:hypothetical protein AX769_22450 [Frondihabitans sp. PAMC 28766]